MRLRRIVFVFIHLCLFRVNVNPHTAYDDEKLARLIAIAKEHSPKAYALVQLLYEGALRI